MPSTTWVDRRCTPAFWFQTLSGIGLAVVWWGVDGVRAVTGELFGGDAVAALVALEALRVPYLGVGRGGRSRARNHSWVPLSRC